MFDYMLIYWTRNNLIDRVRKVELPLYAVRTQLLLEGFTLQLDRDGREFQNPVTQEVVTI